MTALSPNTLMRMQYCASELGYTLAVVTPATPTLTMTKDIDRKTVHSTGVAAAASAVKTAMAPVDPTIISAT